MSRQIVKEYRQQNALIVGIWNKLDAAFKASVGGDFEISLPSGRSLRYAEVMIERKAVADPDHPGKWKIKRVHTALAFDQKRSAVVRKPFYGGLLTENLVQATARDIFGECVLALNRTPGLNVLWTVHDEAVIEAREDIPVSYVKECMSRTPAWMPGLPVACEVKVISHYEK